MNLLQEEGEELEHKFHMLHSFTLGRGTIAEDEAVSTLDTNSPSHT